MTDLFNKNRERDINGSITQIIIKYRRGKMSTSTLSSLGKDFSTMASELSAIVSRDKTPQAARAYLGWIANLGRGFYNPPRGELEAALDLAVGEVESAGLDTSNAIKNYQFFRHVAQLYGLSDRVAIYNAKIVKFGSASRSKFV